MIVSGAPRYKKGKGSWCKDLASYPAFKKKHGSFERFPAIAQPACPLTGRLIFMT